MSAWRCVAFVNRTGRIGPKICVPFRKIDEGSCGAVSWNTQPNCRTSFKKATAFLSPPFFGVLFGCSSPFLCGNDHLLPNVQPDSNFREDANCHRVSFVQIPFKKSLHGCRLDFTDGLRPLRVPFFRLTSTSWWLRGWSGFWCWFCTLINVVPETVSFRTLPFCFPLLANSVSLFNTF